MDMDQLAVIVKQVSDFVWDNLLLYLLVLTGVLFSSVRVLCRYAIWVPALSACSARSA